MKKFVLYILLLIISYVVTVLLLRVVWINTIPYQKYDNKLDRNIHTIVIGPSNGAYAWNDSILNHSINLCCAGANFESSFYRLRWAKECNNNNIDTVVLCASIQTFFYYTDSILDLDNRFIYTERNSLLFYDDFFRNNIHNKEYIKIALTTMPFTYFAHTYEYDGYCKSEKVICQNEIENFDSMVNKQIGSSDGFTAEYIKMHCSYQVKFLKQISDYCQTNNIQLVVFSPPVHRSFKQLSYSGYNEIIKELCNENTLIADYSFMNLEDNCYYDCVHLNTVGATTFSEYVRDNGLECHKLMISK